MHDLGVEGGRRSILRRDWGRFFWLVQLRRGDQWDLRTGIEGQDASTLVLWFVVACGGGGAVANGQGGISAAAVECVGVSAGAVAAVVGGGKDAVAATAVAVEVGVVTGTAAVDVAVVVVGTTVCSVGVGVEVFYVELRG